MAVTRGTPSFEWRINPLPQYKKRLETAAALMYELTQDTRNIHITVSPSLIYVDDDGEGLEAAGLAWLGYPRIELNASLFRPVRVNPADFMPVKSRVSTLTYTLAHEWGHTTDDRTGWEQLAQRRACRCVRTVPSVLAGNGAQEMYAEVYAEWYLSRGRTQHRAARWFAKRNRWRGYNGQSW